MEAQERWTLPSQLAQGQGGYYDMLRTAGFLFAIWAIGRLCRQVRLSPSVGALVAGMLLGPEFSGFVPFATPTCASISSRTTNASKLPADAVEPTCSHDLWRLIGNAGITLLIFEFGTQISFSKLKQVRRRAVIMALASTLLPIAVGVFYIVVSARGRLAEGFAVGLALAPTSPVVLRALDADDLLNSLPGQTAIHAIFLGMVASLLLFFVLVNVASSSDLRVGLRAPYLHCKNTNCSVGSRVLVGVCGTGGLADALDNRAARVVADSDWLGHLRGVTAIPTPREGHRPRATCRARLDPAARRGALDHHDGHARGTPRLLFTPLPSAPRHGRPCLLLLVAWQVLATTTSFLCDSHLLGTFVAGMCFVGVGRSRQVWRVQLKRIRSWCVRLFYGCTIGFSVPVNSMRPELIFQGVLLGLLGGLLSKLLPALLVRYGRDMSPLERAAARKASRLTRSGHIEPSQVLLGATMVARGELSFLFANKARMTYMPAMRAEEPPVPLMSDDAFTVCMWALLGALVAAPLLLQWSVALFKRAKAAQRRGSLETQLRGPARTNFAMNIVGRHFPGLVTEIANTLRVSGMDVFEGRILCDGSTEIARLILQPRGNMEDFDDERIGEMRGAIEMLTGDKGTVVYFEEEAKRTYQDAVVEVQAVGEIHRPGAARIITALMTELGLFVQQGHGVTSIQMSRGFQVRIGHGSWYAINSDAAKPVTAERVERVRTLLAFATSSDELKQWLNCTFMVKMVPSTEIPPKPYNAFCRYSAIIAGQQWKKERWELPVQQDGGDSTSASCSASAAAAYAATATTAKLGPSHTPSIGTPSDSPSSTEPEPEATPAFIPPSRRMSKDKQLSLAREQARAKAALATTSDALPASTPTPAEACGAAACSRQSNGVNQVAETDGCRTQETFSPSAYRAKRKSEESDSLNAAAASATAGTLAAAEQAVAAQRAAAHRAAVPSLAEGAPSSVAAALRGAGGGGGATRGKRRNSFTGIIGNGSAGASSSGGVQRASSHTNSSCRDRLRTEPEMVVPTVASITKDLNLHGLDVTAFARRIEEDVAKSMMIADDLNRRAMRRGSLFNRNLAGMSVDQLAAANRSPNARRRVSAMVRRASFDSADANASQRRPARARVSSEDFNCSSATNSRFARRTRSQEVVSTPMDRGPGMVRSGMTTRPKPLSQPAPGGQGVPQRRACAGDSSSLKPMTGGVNAPVVRLSQLPEDALRASRAQRRHSGSSESFGGGGLMRAIGGAAIGRLIASLSGDTQLAGVERSNAPLGDEQRSRANSAAEADVAEPNSLAAMAAAATAAHDAELAAERRR